MAVTWVLEAEVFPESHARMCAAVRDTGNSLLLWNEDWWETEQWPALTEQPTVFHGSLGNADTIAQRLPWRPGAFCDTAAFHCTAWYPDAAPWLLHRTWTVVPACDLVGNPEDNLAPLGTPEAFFVRPDSPLKPFSGRVLRRDNISWRALDFGFYYEDETLPIILAPVRTVTREWRYVMVDGAIIAGSAYAAEQRAAIPDTPSGTPWHFAASVAGQMNAPQSVSVLDICEADGDLFVLECNPFSGADLYACDRTAVVDAVSDHCRTRF